MGYRLGVDVGGTFTDLLLFNADTGAFWRHKTPSTPHDSSEGILNGVNAICANAGVDAAGIEYFLHGTTVATKVGTAGSGYSWIFHTLPYMEEGAFYDRIKTVASGTGGQFSVLPSAPAISGSFANVQMAGLICPSYGGDAILTSNLN